MCVSEQHYPNAMCRECQIPQAAKGGVILNHRIVQYYAGNQANIYVYPNNIDNLEVSGYPVTFFTLGAVLW